MENTKNKCIIIEFSELVQYSSSVSFKVILKISRNLYVRYLSRLNVFICHITSRNSLILFIATLKRYSIVMYIHYTAVSYYLDILHNILWCLVGMSRY